MIKPFQYENTKVDTKSAPSASAGGIKPFKYADSPTIPTVTPTATPKVTEPVVISAWKPGQKQETISANKGDGVVKLSLGDKLRELSDKIFRKNEGSVAKTMREQQRAFETMVDNPSATDIDGKSPFKTIQDARDMKKSKVPTAKGVLEGLTDVGKSDIPVAGAVIDATEIAQVYNTSQKMKRGEEIKPEEYQKLVDFYTKETELSEKRKLDAGYRVGEGLRNSLTFMAELGGASLLAPVTGGGSVAGLVAEKGAYKAGKEIVSKMLADKVLNDLLKKELKQYGIGLAKRGAVIAGSQELIHLPEDTLKRMVGTPEITVGNGSIDVSFANDGQSLPEATLNAFTGILVETASEYTGGVFSSIPKVARNQLVKAGILKAIVAKNPNLPANAVEKVIKAVGWNGVIEEMLEEQAGNLANGTLEKMGLGDTPFHQPTLQEIGEQFLSFALMGTVISGVSKGYEAIVKKKMEEETPKDVKDMTDTLADYVESATKEKTPAEIISDLESIGVDSMVASEIVQNAVKEAPQNAPIVPLDLSAIGAEALAETQSAIESPAMSEISPEALEQSIDDILSGRKIEDVTKEEMPKDTKKEAIQPKEAKKAPDNKNLKSKVSDVYREHYEMNKDLYTDDKIWNQQMLENISEEHEVENAVNPKGIVTGDRVLVTPSDKYAQYGDSKHTEPYMATVLDVNDTTDAPAYEGGFSVHLLGDNGKYAVHAQIADVEKKDGPKEKNKPREKEPEAKKGSVKNAGKKVTPKAKKKEEKSIVDELLKEELTQAEKVAENVTTPRIEEALNQEEGAFELFENEGEYKTIFTDYKGRPLANVVYDFLDKKQKKEYDSIRDRMNYGTKAEAEKQLKDLQDFENKHKEAFKEAKKTIDTWESEKEEINRKKITEEIKYNGHKISIEITERNDTFRFEVDYADELNMGDIVSIVSKTELEEQADRQGVNLETAITQKASSVALNVFDEKAPSKRDQMLLDYRKGALPEFNMDEDLRKLDVFVDKIRPLDPKKEADKFYIGKGAIYEVKISYPASLGEMGIFEVSHYNEYPTVQDIKENTLEIYNDFLKDHDNTARAENIASAIEKALDAYNGGGTIETYDSDRQKGISDTSDIPSGENRGISESSPNKISRYDRATMLAQLGNGLVGDRTAELTKKQRQLINEEVESILEARNYSTNTEDYSEEDRLLMSAYTGAGGKESVGATGAGLLNEYYTPPKVISKVWDIAKKLLPNAQSAFEPSVGTGRFIGLSPVEIKVNGAEISKVSGTIASVLYPDSNIIIGDFQELFFDKKTNKQKGTKQYDLVVGNPPFGDRAGFLKGKGEESDINREEEYFIKRGLDMVKEGGYLIYVVNSSFLKKGVSAGKNAISQLGQLEVAYRLPEDSFEDTTIGTDIVIFKKNETIDPISVMSRNQTLRDDMYFRSVLGGNNVLGETLVRKNRFGQQETYVKGSLDEAIDKINPDFLQAGEVKETDSITAIPEKEGVVYSDIQEETTIKSVNDIYKLVNSVKPVPFTDNGNSISFEFISDDRFDKDIDQKINEYIKDFEEKAKNAGADYKMYGVRDVNFGEPEPTKQKRVQITIQKPVKTKKEKVSTPKKGIVYTQTTFPKKGAEKLVVEKQNISNKTNYSPVEVNMLKKIDRDLAIQDPTPAEIPFLNYAGGEYFNDGIYFSGEVYKKLTQLENDKEKIIAELGQEQYDKQKKGLEAVIPKRVAIKEVTFDPLDRHIAEIKATSNRGENSNVLNVFADWVRTNDIALSPRVSKWDVLTFARGQNLSKGTKPIEGYIKSDAKRLFNQFLKNELAPEVQKEIEDKYNVEKNGYIQPDYTKIPVEIENMSKQFRGRDFLLSETQKNGIGFLVNKGSGLIAYGVGVGKTHTLAIATVANMQKGWSSRPLYVVPKSTIDKTWLATLQQMFPTLVINNLEGLQAPVIRRLIKEKGENKADWIKDGELTIISHEGILRLGLKEEELRTAVSDLKDALWIEPKTQRGGEKTKSAYDEIAGNAQKYVTDVMISDLGFDHISVDEVHNFRKVFQGAKAEKVDAEGKAFGKKRYANILGGTPSRRAQQLFLISQYIQKKNNNRNVFLASATPFENHATEVYNILSFVARDRMRAMGILNINDFFATFANFEVELDRKLDGEWVNREKMKSFANLPTLQNLLKEFIDYQEDPTLVRPDRRVITPHLQMSELQTKNLARIQNLLTGVKDQVEDTEGFDEESKAFFDVADSIKEKEEGAFLKASTYSIANSVSPYFIKEYVRRVPSAEQLVEDSPKIKYAIETLKTVKADPKTADFGTFIFFGTMGVSYHPMIAEYIAKEVGYKRDEVAVLSGNITDDQKEDIKERFNDGRVKVLLGGDQTKEGIDLQNNGFITINLAMGWNPTEIAQVEGRVWRQGNRRSIAPLIYPLVENSGDSTIFNKFEEKGGRINDLFSYKGKMFDVGEIDPAEKKLSLLTDPKDKAKMQIEIDKTATYNERLLLDNDIKELRAINADKNQMSGDLAEFEKQIETGLDRWGDSFNEATLKEMKKEVKSLKGKIERLDARIEAKNITDINAEIGELEAKIIDMDAKIKAIDQTYDEKLAFFSEQYKKDIKNRKSMAQHMEQIQSLINEVEERTPEEVDAIRAKKIRDEEARKMGSIPEFQKIESDPTQITLKTLERIGDRKTVSKQFISDLARRTDIKLVEKNIIEEALLTEEGTVVVADFKKKVLMEVLPITVTQDEAKTYGPDRLSYVLPEEIRGNVAEYRENVYESPIKNMAGNKHFGRGNFDGDRIYPEGYFGHTRVEDMEDDSIRRVIEVQSDLYQKGNLDKELSVENSVSGSKITPEKLKELYPKKYAEIQSKQKLQQYNDPTAHFFMARKEIKQASQEGFSKIQFPTGETAMQIEKLGDSFTWRSADGSVLESGNMKIGDEVGRSRDFEDMDDSWIITDVLGGGKFKAVPKARMESYEKIPTDNPDDIARYMENDKETFDISGEVDTTSPIYEFYEKELGKYLKNKYDAKLVKDPQGVSWYEIDLTNENAQGPLEAFQKETSTGEPLISFEEAKNRIEEYKNRLKLDFDVDFADVIFTGGINKDGTKERAYAVTYNNKISLTENVRKTTADHEVVHIVMNHIDKISAFEGITRDQLLKAMNGGKDYTEADLERLNEEIAINFEKKVQGAEQAHLPMVLRKFFERLEILLTKLLKALGKDVDVIQDFYRRLYSARGKEMVKLETSKLLDKEVQFNKADKQILAFNEARAEYLRTTRVDFQKVLEVVKDHSVNLRRKDINLFDQLFAQSRDLFLKDKTEFAQADALMKIGDERRMKKSLLDKKFAKMLDPYFNLRSESKTKVNEVLVQGDIDTKEYSDTELTRKGLSQAEIDAYKAVRKSFNVAHDLLLSEMEANGVPPEEIDQFRNDRIGYLPHKWKYRFAIKTQKIKTGADPKDPSSWTTETMDTYKTATLADKAFTELVKNNTTPDEVRYVNDTLDSLEVDFFSEQRFSFENMKSIIAKAKVDSEIKTEMLASLRNMVKEKGFGRNFIKRTGISGYIGGGIAGAVQGFKDAGVKGIKSGYYSDIPSVIANYFAGLDGFITKMEAGKKYYGVLEKIDARRQKRFYEWTRNSIAYDMGNTKEGNAFKEFAYIFFLANDISFLVTNMTQNFTVGIGELSKLFSGTDKIVGAETTLMKAMADWSIGNVTAEEKAVINGLVDLGRLGGEMTAELMGFKNNPVYAGVSSILNKALYNSTAVVEKNVNRIPAFLAARRILKSRGLSDKEANEQALSVSDDIHFRYGKQHRPVFMRGRKSVLFVFNHYMRSFLYQLSRDLKNREFTAVIKKLFYTTLLGGTASLPFAKYIKDLYKWIFGPDPDEEQEAELKSMELALERGIPASYLNIDLSNKVGIDIMALTNVVDELNTTKTIKEKAGNILVAMTGAVGSLTLDRIPKGIDLIQQGRYIEGVSKLSPDFIGNTLKAYSGATKGVVSQSGNPLIDEYGNNFKYTTYEAFVKATGYTPTREQLAWDEQSKEWELKNKNAEGNAEVRDKIKKLINTGKVEEARKYQEEARVSGELSSGFDYVRDAVKDDAIRSAVETWESGRKTQIQLDKIEENIAKAMYGKKYSAQNLTDVTQEFAFRRTFGYNDKNANDLKKATSNKDKVLVLKRIRQELGADEFRVFFNKGRKVVQYKGGGSGYVLISNPLKDLYTSSK